MENKNATDFLGNELKIGDKVLCVIGQHLKKGIIENILGDSYMHQIKIKGLKAPLVTMECVKHEWKSPKPGTE
jgi:hypothetical protein